jgi:hypothetical protein
MLAATKLHPLKPGRPRRRRQSVCLGVEERRTFLAAPLHARQAGSREMGLGPWGAATWRKRVISHGTCAEVSALIAALRHSICHRSVSMDWMATIR